MGQWNENWQSTDLKKKFFRNNFSVYATLPQDTGASYPIRSKIPWPNIG